MTIPAIDGPAWASWGQGLRRYLAGDLPLELTPAAGGDPITFVHDAKVGESDGAVNPLESGELVAYTEEPLALRSVWTWGGVSWTVDNVETDQAGAGVWPCRTTLVKHAG